MTQPTQGPPTPPSALPTKRVRKRATKPQKAKKPPKPPRRTLPPGGLGKSTRGIAYGWHRDLPDTRDHRFGAVRPATPTSLPSSCLSIPTRASLEAFNQGPIGACTGNGIAFLLFWARLMAHGSAVVPSRLFIYFNERVMEGTVSQDAGASIRDGVKSVAKLGSPDEALWNYNHRFNVKPSTAAYRNALRHQALHYSRLADGDVEATKTALALDLPVVFGFTVYESFEDDWTATTGAMRTPLGRVLGGHCVVAVGYDDRVNNGDGTVGAVLVRNSWGTDWGIHPADPVPAGQPPVPEAFAGHFWMPYHLFRAMASDLWTIDRVEV